MFLKNSLSLEQGQTQQLQQLQVPGLCRRAEVTPEEMQSLFMYISWPNKSGLYWYDPERLEQPKAKMGQEISNKVSHQAERYIKGYFV